MAKRLLIFGPPGAGKGTHASRLASELKIPHVATGDMFRESIQQKTAFGVQAAEYIRRGELVPDDLVIEALDERIGRPDVRDGFLLDGFPRTLPQAQALHRVLTNGGRAIDCVLCLEAPEDVLVRRIAGRSTCSRCTAVFNQFYRPPRAPGRCDRCGAALVQRPDDAEAAVRRRLDEYRGNTNAVLGFFASHGWPVHTVHSVGEVDEIFERVKAAVAD